MDVAGSSQLCSLRREWRWRENDDERNGERETKMMRKRTRMKPSLAPKPLGDPEDCWGGGLFISVVKIRGLRMVVTASEARLHRFQGSY